MDRVKGKVVFVTGGTSGIGKACAFLLAKEGASVIISGLNEDKGKSIVHQLNSNRDCAFFIKQDVCEESDWRAAIDQIMNYFGKLDVLVNNAGGAVPRNVESISLEEWREVTTLNLDSIFLGTKYGIEAMKKSGGGSIINMSSVVGIVGHPFTSAYAASKGGVRTFTKSVAIYCGQAGYNIRVNSIHPGFIWTPLLQKCLGEENPEAGRKELDKLQPLGHIGEPEDIAYGVLYLASDESKFMTGGELVIDGGYTAQ